MAPEWERLAVRALGSVETELTVLGSRRISPTYQRIDVADGGLLTRHDPYPTMWLRLWFNNDGRTHQRAFTVVDPRPAEGRFSLEFALHDGTAADWARSCKPGQCIRASLLGSKPPWSVKKPRRRRGGAPRQQPTDASNREVAPDQDSYRFGQGNVVPAASSGRTVVVGDPAALPAVNALLTEMAHQEVEVWLEHRAADDRLLPVCADDAHRVTWVHRTADDQGIGQRLLSHWEECPPQPQDRFWIAVEATETRMLNTALHSRYQVPRDQVCATAYWRDA